LSGLISQVVARKVVHANFYEAALLQDGYRMEHIVPPRDIHAWQNLPISAIARFEPAMVESLEPEALRTALENPFQRFPVVNDSALTGFSLGRRSRSRSRRGGHLDSVARPQSVPGNSFVRCKHCSSNRTKRWS
ncbi:MAG TPA: hypothetical protein VFI76_05555, partial [Terrimicrobiaceae bacterium]|nr:hypothetical protein [Terrimicrobiaceae bacterium]